MSITETLTSNGTTIQIITSYSVTSSSGSGSSATYMVSISENEVGVTTLSGTATYLGSGTVTSITFDQQTFTGAEATSFMASFMTPFTLELSVQATYQAYLASLNVVKVNSTSISIGPSSVSVTNYKATNTPFTITSCGTSETINSLQIQIGQVAGSSYGALITFESFNGVSGGSAVSFVLQITSIT